MNEEKDIDGGGDEEGFEDRKPSFDITHHRLSDYVLMGLTLSMFITNIILIAVLAFYSYRVSMNDQRYAAMKQDYIMRFEEVERKHDVKFHRLMESINTLQFTTNKRIDLMNEKIDRK